MFFIFVIDDKLHGKTKANNVLVHLSKFSNISNLFVAFKG